LSNLGERKLFLTFGVIFVFIKQIKKESGGEIMKKLVALTMSLFILLCGFVGVGLFANARTVMADTDLNVTIVNENDEKYTITISGEATKDVTPDKATIYATVETLDLDMNKSKEDNFAVFEELLKALKDAGIEKDKIVFEGFSSYPSYDYTSGKSLTGYRSTTSFSVALDDIADIANILDVLTKNGVTNIRHINYEVSNLEDVYQDVLLEALENAKLKAQKVTQREDIKIVSVREEQVYSSTSLYRDYGNTIQDNAVIGQLTIKARVTVSFE